MKKLTATVLAFALLLTLFSAPALAAEDAEAALAEGMGYWWGTGPDGYDMKKAEAAFRRAADLGSADAWYWLGDLAYNGVEDGHLMTALSCFQKAADLGSPMGLYGLGSLYREEKWGIRQNFKTAQDYFQQTIDAGCLLGYIGMGTLYEEGEGVEKDGNKALEYFIKAADAEDWFIRCAAYTSIGYLYYYGSEGLESDGAQAMEWTQKAADEGFVSAYSNMGYYTEYPLDSSEPDYVKGAEWYEKAAACGQPYDLATNYLNGYGVKRNLKHGIELFKQSVAGGRDAVESLAGLARAYALGEGVAQNTDKAIEYANRALAVSCEYRSNVIHSGFGVGLAVEILDVLGQ